MAVLESRTAVRRCAYLLLADSEPDQADTLDRLAPQQPQLLTRRVVDDVLQVWNEPASTRRHSR